MEDHESLIPSRGLSGPFLAIPLWLFSPAFRGLSDGSRMLYGYLLSCRLAAWRVPAWSELAARLGVSRRQIARRFAELQDAGLLRVEAASVWPRTVRYVLLEPDAEPAPIEGEAEAAAAGMSQPNARNATETHAAVPQTSPPAVPHMTPSVVPNTSPLYPIYKMEEEKERDITPPVPPPGGSACEEVWRELLSVYPKRGGGLGHTEGRKVLERLLKAKTDPKAILEGARRYAAYIRATKREGTEYVAMIPTWLRQRRWEEDWTPPRDPKAEEEEAKRRHAEELREFLGLRKLED
ncbi:MAG: helix-turn-helix domain-containing protein [Armatimonadetes bacterium]|nr:helix-turn-helix domain-containing protein [Armatimonadota bacterium]MCA1998033.1 helix-turn-helix domain-containing protein [Armatimonadota bacterium]